MTTILIWFAIVSLLFGNFIVAALCLLIVMLAPVVKWCYRAICDFCDNVLKL